MKSYRVGKIDTKDVNEILLELSKNAKKQEEQNQLALADIGAFYSVLDSKRTELQNTLYDIDYYINYITNVIKLSGN